MEQGLEPAVAHNFRKGFISQCNEPQIGILIEGA